MISIKIKKGYHLALEGQPTPEIETLDKPADIAVLPERIPFVKPRLTVKVGDAVNIGSPLFVDKRNPAIRFLSPGGGKITRINFGARRSIKEIVIRLDENETHESFGKIAEKDLSTIGRRRLIQTIMEGGLWPLIRELPFRDIARPDTVPPGLFVHLDDVEPFHPVPEAYLGGKTGLFKYGLEALQRLVDGKVYISIADRKTRLPKELEQLVTHTVSGNYPATDPGVLLYHLKRSPRENRSWFISGQEVLLVAQLLKSGQYPTRKMVVLAGSSARERKHFQTRIGFPLRQITQNRAEAGCRYVVGGIYRGYKASDATYMGFYESSLSLIPEGDQREFLGFVRPGFRKPSYSRAFGSCLRTSVLEIDCNRHGGERACIACGNCAGVCPVNIFPQLTFKSILADEMEEYLAHGLLDCVECGLCSYVCPSKIELLTTFKKAKAQYYREQAIT